MIRRRPVDFSLWPVRSASGGHALNPRLFVSDPWPLLGQIARDVKNRTARAAASAFLEQSFDFYNAASRAQVAAAKPLLLYYCFLNLAKALIVIRSPATAINNIQHGLKERLNATGKELTGAFLIGESKATSAFNMLLTAVRGNGIAADTNYDLPTLMRQILPAHRLYALASKRAGECFVSVDHLELLQDNTHIWARFSIASGDLSRLGITQSSFRQRARLTANWKAVATPPNKPSNFLWFESAAPIAYTKGDIINSIPTLIDPRRQDFWQAILSIPPYRNNYIYFPPLAEHPYILPQILSGYAVIFYFGSITRYRPHHFDSILRGSYGPFAEAFLNEGPSQLLFLFASEFAQRDITRPAIV